jgi:hypothetical protein
MDNCTTTIGPSSGPVYPFDVPFDGDGGPTQDVASPAERYAVIIFLSILSAVGAVGNGIVLWVFWARRDRVVATLFIVVLATVDLTTCIVVVPFTVYMEATEFSVSIDAVCKLYQVRRRFSVACGLRE